jgi:hypothetical protein
VREKYCWLVAGGWFVLREKYHWLVADKPNEQAENLRAFEAVRLTWACLSRLISSHITLFILPAEHYSSNQPNKLFVLVSLSGRMSEPSPPNHLCTLLIDHHYLFLDNGIAFVFMPPQ